MNHPLVSIAMPVKNNRRTLPLTIESLLAQTHQNWELILIDDGSSDGTADVARSFNDPRIQVHPREASQGLAARLNEAIDLARGPYLARMDGDDIAYPERLSAQVEFLEANPDVDLVGAWTIVFDAKGTPFGKRSAPTEHEAICSYPVNGIPLAHPTFCGRLPFFQRFGYRTNVGTSEDQDLLLRSCRFARFANLPRLLLGYREEKLNLRKILSTRVYMARTISEAMRDRGRRDLAARAVAEQCAKGCLDVVAIGSGLHYKLLRTRARPASDEECEEWQQLWQNLNEQHQRRTSKQSFVQTVMPTATQTTGQVT